MNILFTNIVVITNFFIVTLWIRIVESHEQISARLESALAENKSLRAASDGLQARANQAVAEAAALQQHNNDLSAQLQNLLRKSLGSGPNSRFTQQIL